MRGYSNDNQGNCLCLSSGDISLIMFPSRVLSLRGTEDRLANAPNVYTISKNSQMLNHYELDIPVYYNINGMGNSWASIGKYIVATYDEGTGIDLLTIDATGKLVKVTDQSKIPAGFSVPAHYKSSGVISQGNHNYLVYVGGESADDRIALKSIEVYKLDATGTLVKKNEYNDSSFNLIGEGLSYSGMSTIITDGEKSFLIFYATYCAQQTLNVYGINAAGNLFKVTAETNGGWADFTIAKEMHTAGSLGKYFMAIYEMAITIYTISNNGYFVRDSEIELPFSVSQTCTASIHGNKYILMFDDYSNNRRACGYTIDKNTGNIVPVIINGTYENWAFLAGSIGEYVITNGGDANGIKEAYKLVPNE